MPAATHASPASFNYLERIDEQVQRLAQRLRHLRSFVRKRSHQVRPLVLADVVTAACGLCDWQYQQAAVGLTVELPAGLPRIYGDAIANRTGHR